MYDFERLVQYIDSEFPSKFPSLHNKKGKEDTEEEKEEECIEGANFSSIMTSRYASSIESRRRMTRGLCEVLNDFGLVSFLPLNISDAATVAKVLAAIGDSNFIVGFIIYSLWCYFICLDLANGYSFAVHEVRNRREFEAQAAKNTSSSSSTSGYLDSVFKYAATDVDTVYSRSLEILERYNTGDKPVSM